jgi:hypothetical protein
MIGPRPEVCEELVATEPTGPRRPDLPRWIILFEDTGELGNRLVTYAHLLALALEYRVAVVNLAFWRYRTLFASPAIAAARPWKERCPERRTRAPGRLVEAGVRAILRVPGVGGWLRRRCSFDGRLVVESPELLERTLAYLLVRAYRYRGSRRILASVCDFRHEKIDGHTFEVCLSKGSGDGWAFDSRLIEKHAEFIRACFRPAAEYRRQIAEWLEPLRARFSLLVGVHVRRGDYCRYRDGRWYYADTVYRRVMNCVAERYCQEQVGFVIASLEPIDAAGFAPLEIVRTPGGLMADMYALAECDLIIGPPSTFSGWASFMGRVPVYWIRDPEAELRWEEDAAPWIPRWY